MLGMSKFGRVWGFRLLSETQAPGRIPIGDPQIHKDLQVHSAYLVGRFRDRLCEESYAECIRNQ